MTTMPHFPNYQQPDHKDCGPTCLKIEAKHFVKVIALQKIHYFMKLPSGMTS
jgi:ATP-binding cassette subfamily B protein